MNATSEVIARGSAVFGRARGSKKLRPILFAASLLALVASAGVAWHLARSPAGPPPGRAAAPPAVTIVSGVAQRQDVPIYLAAVGTVQALNTVTIRVRVDGQLETVAFGEGQYVKSGDLLAQIDARPFQAQLAQAAAQKLRDEVQLANAKRDLERLTSLAARDIATKQSLDTQRALVAQLGAAIQGDQALVDSANVQLGYATIRSPIDGYAGMRLVDQGNIVHANDANGLVVITQRQPISITFTLPQDALDDVGRAMSAGRLKVVVFKRDDRTQLDEGTLEVVDNQIDQGTGTIRLKATAPNGDGRLWPGQFVNTRLMLGVRRDAVTVPARVVQRGPGGSYAYVIKADQTVELRLIKVGAVGDDVAVIETGLAAGERVVVDGQLKLHAGTRVELDSAAVPLAGHDPSS